MLGIKKQKETMVSKVVDLRTLPKVPRDPRMLANNGGVPLGKKSGVARLPPSSLSWGGGSKTKMKDGKGVMNRARREAREISMRSKLVTPTSQLVGNKRQIQKAPAGMVNEYRKAADPGLRILSRKKSTVRQFSGGISGPSLEEREKRLRAAMGGGSSMTGNETLIGSSDEDSFIDDDEEVDDLFDDEPPRPSRPLSASSISRPPPKDINRPRPVASSSSPATRPFDSGRPKPGPSSSPPPRASTSSPVPGGAKPMMPRKRPPVDVFNRGVKKPRVSR